MTKQAKFVDEPDHTLTEVEAAVLWQGTALDKIAWANDQRARAIQDWMRISEKFQEQWITATEVAQQLFCAIRDGSGEITIADLRQQVVREFSLADDWHSLTMNARGIVAIADETKADAALVYLNTLQPEGKPN